MPMDRSLYPPEWKAIALRVKDEAGWRCQNPACGRACRFPGETITEFCERVGLPIEKVRKHRQRWTLTVAHLDHDPWNPNARLAALCAPCHCRYDLKAMAYKRRLKRERIGQLRLEGV